MDKFILISVLVTSIIIGIIFLVFLIENMINNK